MRHGSRSLIRLCVGLVVAGAFASERAGAEVPPSQAPRGPVEVATDGIVTLQSEILVLVELDAFAGQLPRSVSDVHTAWKSSLSGLDRDGLLDWLRTADQYGLGRLDELVATGTRPTPAIDQALRLLPPGDLDALTQGRTIAMRPDVYAAALENLENIIQGKPAGGPLAEALNSVTRPPMSSLSTIPPTSADVTPATIDHSSNSSEVPSEEGEASEEEGYYDAEGNFYYYDDDDGYYDPDNNYHYYEDPNGYYDTDGVYHRLDTGGGERRLLYAIIGAVAVGLAGAVVLWRRRRRRKSSSRDDRIDEVLDAGRRIATSLDPIAVQHASVSEAMALTGAEAVALVTAGPPPVLIAEAPDGAFDPALLARGVVARVIETGQPTRFVGTDALWPADEPRAVCAVAVTAGGRVAGALVCLRRAGQPFDVSDQERLSRLAPFVATALDASMQHHQVTEQSMTDALTRLANRRRLDQDLTAALSTRAGQVAFAMVDIDHFKVYNDTHGHPAGDDVLRSVAVLLRDNVRPSDVVYRYGGEEFCVLLPGTTMEEATVVAERLRLSVCDTEFPGGDRQPGGRLTISVGVALAAQPDAGELKARADHALYDAKHAGRNRVVVAP